MLCMWEDWKWCGGELLVQPWLTIFPMIWITSSLFPSSLVFDYFIHRSISQLVKVISFLFLLSWAIISSFLSSSILTCILVTREFLLLLLLLLLWQFIPCLSLSPSSAPTSILVDNCCRYYADSEWAFVLCWMNSQSVMRIPLVLRLLSLSPPLRAMLLLPFPDAAYKLIQIFCSANNWLTPNVTTCVHVNVNMCESLESLRDKSREKRDTNNCPYYFILSLRLLSCLMILVFSSPTVLHVTCIRFPTGCILSPLNLC